MVSISFKIAYTVDSIYFPPIYLLSFFGAILVFISFIRIYELASVFILTSPSVSVASRRITLSQRPLRDLCSIMFGATRLKETTKKSYLKSACLITPLVIGIKLIRLFLRFVYFMKTSTINIHIRKI